MYYMKTDLYTWRLPMEVKLNLERAARLRGVPVSAVLDVAVREWLRKTATEAEGDEAQRKLHAAAARCLGTLASANPYRAETARELVRERLRRRRAR